MFGLGAAEIFVIGVLALVLIGPKKLPELARSLGKGFREFQRAKDDLLNQVHHQGPDKNIVEGQSSVVDKAENPSGTEAFDPKSKS